MHKLNCAFLASMLIIVQMAATSVLAQGNPDSGKKAFLKCVMCHSAQPNVHKTGPSLANIWGKKAGAIEGFSRYSDAVKNSGVVWNDETLDTWLRDPRSLIPGTLMKIRGIDSRTERQNIVAYLKRLASGNGRTSTSGKESSLRDGMMGASEPADLSSVSTRQQVTALSYCPDTYQLTTAAGATLKFWEFNLRFKTDSSGNGPPKGHPVFLRVGMRGDRAFIVFAAPSEISAFIEEKC